MIFGNLFEIKLDYILTLKHLIFRFAYEAMGYFVSNYLYTILHLRRILLPGIMGEHEPGNSNIIRSLNGKCIIRNTYILQIKLRWQFLKFQVRFLMKSHAFIRSNVPNILKHKQHSDERLDLPTLEHYLYFSFAPTLLYRKHYPRTEARNIKRATLHFLDVLGIIWLESYIYEIFFLHSFENFGKGEVDWMNVAVIITQNAIAGGLIMLVNFYLILHAWCNCFADLMRFADKRFYEVSSFLYMIFNL